MLRRRNVEGRIGVMVSMSLLVAGGLVSFGAGFATNWLATGLYFVGAISTLMCMGVLIGWSNYSEYLKDQLKEDA